ncbi:MAG: recombinase family protein [bacterium]|nr:recombinase family protein [bacterium]
MVSVEEPGGLVTAVGYLRVSTTDQAESGAGLEAQRQAVAGACGQRGWRLADVFEDGGRSGKNLNRQGFSRAIEAVESGTAQVLVVAKLDRLSRSLMDFAAVMDRAQQKGWHVVALDLGVDTSTPSGEMIANVMASFAQFERRMIGQRTREALAVKKAQGVRIGRPPATEGSTIRRMRELRAEGLSYRRVARQLDEEGHSTAHGAARWDGSTVRRTLIRASSQPSTD